jgi:hypothetical protein
MTTVSEREPNLARPWAPHRARIYLGTGLFTGTVFTLMTIGVATGFIAPTFTVDVVANLLFGLPLLLLPLVILWNASGENRSRLDFAAELTMFWLPYTACSQISYELLFVIGYRLDWWVPTTDPGWKWFWWQFGLADTRYANGNPWIFGLEIVSVISGALLFAVWTRLLRPDLSTDSRLRCLWLAFAGCAALMTTTAVYVISEAGVGFADIGQGAFGVWFKFLAEILPFIVLPPVVLYAIHLQIDYVARRSGPRNVAADGALR